MKTNETSIYKPKGLEFYITDAISKTHAVQSFIHYRIGVTESEIELFEGKIPDTASVMKAIETSTRASNWFTSKTYLEQHALSDKYFESKHPSLLTIEQVEEIWEKEVGDLILHIGEQVDESYPKEFQEAYAKRYSQEEVNRLLDQQFDESLFISYIDKFSNKDLRNMFRILSLKLQEQIIGYIKVGDKYEPAISKDETFMPLSSFGIANTHIYGNFIPFPNNKTLAEMCEEPLDFYQWCKENKIK